MSPDFRVVLVRPRNPLNIGAAARAMANFGLRDLVLVAPHDPVWQEARSAPGAQSLLRAARVVSRLHDAIEDRTWVLATSSLSRRQPSQPVLSLDRLSGEWKKRFADRIALVFGPEKTGLSNHDLSLCHSILRIPTVPGCASMNLGQAVAVCCYEFRRLSDSRPPKPPAAPNKATHGEITRLIEEIEKLVYGTANPIGKSEARRLRQLRQKFLRWPVTREEVSLLLGVLRDLTWRSGRK